MDPTALLTNAAAFQLGVAAFRSALAVQASVLQLFPPPAPIEPAQAGQPAAPTDTLGTQVNTVA
jgi:hypothetical protein